MSEKKERWDKNNCPKYLGEAYRGNVVNVKAHQTTNADGTKSDIGRYRRRKSIE